MLKQIITEEYQLSGILPETGSVHQWSPEIKKEIRKKFPVFSEQETKRVASRFRRVEDLQFYYRALQANLYSLFALF